MDNVLKIGDKVLWRGAWGREAAQSAKVTGMELCKRPREKYGISVDSMEWSQKEYLVVNLDNGHWAYGEQIDPLN